MARAPQRRATIAGRRINQDGTFCVRSGNHGINVRAAHGGGFIASPTKPSVGIPFECSTRKRPCRDVRPRRAPSSLNLRKRWRFIFVSER